MFANSWLKGLKKNHISLVISKDWIHLIFLWILQKKRYSVILHFLRSKFQFWTISKIASKQQRKLKLLLSKQLGYRATEIIYLIRSYKVRHSKVWKVIWLKTIEKMEILTVPDYFHVADRMEFWYFCLLFTKEKREIMKN